MMMVAWAGALALVAGTALACSSSSAASTGGADSGGPTDSNSAGPVDSSATGTMEGGACNALANTAPVVMEQWVASPFPTPMGGTITDGTYYLTAATLYDGDGGMAGATGVTYQLVVVVSGGTFQYVEAISGVDGGVTNDTINGSITTTGTNVAIDFTCGQTGTSPFTMFDGNLTMVTTYDPVSMETFAYTREQ